MLRKIVLLTLAPLALFAQDGVILSYQMSGSSAAAVPLTSGATISFSPIAAGSAALATIYCNNQSQSAYTLSVSVNNGAFSVAPVSSQLTPGGSAAIAVTFAANSAGSTAGEMSIILTPDSGVAQVIRFTLSGQTVDGVLASVSFPSDGNQMVLVDGATIAFPSGVPGMQSPATFTVTNRSSSSVSLDALLLSGANFSLSGLPLLPLTIASSSSVSVTLLFTPTQPGVFTGTLMWSISGVQHHAILSGTAPAAALDFAVGSAALQSGGSISFPATAVATPSVLALTVRNTGNAPAQIANLTASPASFQLQSPPTLPLTIAAGSSANLNLAFVPQAPGNVSGTLTIGSASFSLAGSGLGPQLTCAVVVHNQTPSACDGSSAITLPSTSLGAQLTFAVQLTNTGNQPATLQNFAIGGNGFSVASLPTLPATLPAGDSIQVNAAFTPTVIGFAGGFLQVNGQTSNLSVAGTAPPPLPAISFTNVSAQMQAFTQPLVGIHLASAYPYALSGQLSLTFTADSLIDDPAIQFVNGQRYVNFTVPAGSTDAVFGTSSPGVVMQTGSTSGVIALAASFSLGSYVVTGSSPVTQNVTIPVAAPQIRAVQFVDEDANGFDLQITGLTTTRSLRALTFTITPSGNASISKTTLSVDVSSAFQSWFSSALSHSFGSQFSITVRFNVAGSLSDLQSISITATNEKGTSNAVSLALQAPASS